MRVALRGVRSGPLVGTLAGADEAGLTLRFPDGSSRTIPLADVAEARREVLFGPGEPS